MDLERLELYVERCPCKELRVPCQEGTFFLGNSHTKTGWYVLFEPGWHSLPTTFERRRLQDIVSLVERTFPELYAWLVQRFS